MQEIRGDLLFGAFIDAGRGRETEYTSAFEWTMGSSKLKVQNKKKRILEIEEIIKKYGNTAINSQKQGKGRRDISRNKKKAKMGTHERVT
eukprot:UN04605